MVYLSYFSVNEIRPFFKVNYNLEASYMKAGKAFSSFPNFSPVSSGICDNGRALLFFFSFSPLFLPYSFFLLFLYSFT